MDKPFRILLDLTDLHIEGFKYVWINVSPRELKTISDLKSDLLKKLNFERHDIKLFVRDGLLLDEETIIVLREDDTVKVQYEEHSVCSQSSRNCSMESKSQRTFQKRSRIECCEDSSPPKAKKSKRSYASTSIEIEELELENKSKKKKKNKKSLGSPSHVSESVVIAVNNNDISSTDVDNTTIALKSSETYVEKPDENYTNDIDGTMIKNKSNEEFTTANETVISEGKQGSSSQKKKRKRHRKRKSNTSLIGSFMPSHDVTDSHCANSTESQSVVPSTSFVRKHIFFTSPTPGQKSVDEVGLKSKIDLESNKAEALNVCSKSPIVNEDGSQNLSENRNSYPKISTPSASNGYNHKNWTVSMLEDELLNSSSQSNIKKTNERKSTSVVKDLSCDLIIAEKCDKISETPSLQDKYRNLPLINIMPAIGAHIAFKMLELDESYSPTVSDYKEGIVKHIDPNTEDMEIELLKKEIKPGRVGKFENLREDEVPDPEIIQTVQVQFSGLIDLRLVS